MGNLYSSLRLIAHGDLDVASDPERSREKLETEFTTPARNLPKHLLNDPRSATIGIDRTPIFALDEDSSLTETGQEPSIDEIEIITEPISPAPVEHKIPPMETDLDAITAEIEEKLNLNKLKVYVDEPLKQKVEEVPAETEPMFLTPQPKALLKKTARTPLGKLCTNSHSPLSSLEKNMKPWKRIREERVRLGLDDPENTPPPTPLPLDDITHSAPGKFSSRSTVLSQDSPLVI